MERQKLWINLLYSVFDMWFLCDYDSSSVLCFEESVIIIEILNV